VRVYPSLEGIGVFFRVITEQKRAEEEQARLQREFHHAQKMQALGTLSGGVAHEFNNLLMAILGFTEMVHGRTDLPTDAFSDLEEVMVAVDRGRSLVDQILAFSRKSAASHRPTRVNESVGRVVRILESTVPRRISIMPGLAPHLPSVRGDPGQLEQVALNLASNAQDAIVGNGTIRIQTECVDVEQPRTAVGSEMPAGQYVRLRVRDDGRGMDESTAERAFDPFFTTKEPGRGTGLGLSTVYGIVRAHQGHVLCQTEPGGGTTIDVHLPVAPPHGASSDGPASGTPARRDRPGRNELILVADDEASLRQYYKRLLERSGYRVLVTDSGERALDLLDSYRGHVALAVFDLGMPGMGGLACLERLRAGGHELPVVIATGYASPDDARSAIEAGAQSVLRKPFERTELLDVIRNGLAEAGPDDG